MSENNANFIERRAIRKKAVFPEIAPEAESFEQLAKKRLGSLKSEQERLFGKVQSGEISLDEFLSTNARRS